MGRSIFSDEYLRLIRLLREARRRAGLSQEEVADRLGQTQSFVSKCERGERRLDVIELLHFCRVLGTDFHRMVDATRNARENHEGKTGSRNKS
jgi:transcriptional regulator with XRE-family HTH domain